VLKGGQTYQRGVRRASVRSALDLLIVATGLANDLPIYNPDDFEDLTSPIDVVSIP
jgi:predicted nucleic acid-binding protein